MILPLLSGAAILAVLFAPRFVRAEAAARVAGRARKPSAWGPLVVAILSPLIVWLVWEQPDPSAVGFDQASYLLQAEIFASGRWTAPTPPLPEFFEQSHVQLVPVLASKYPPGHALLLALGTLVGYPALVPLLLSAATGALLFSLVTRLPNASVALFAWVFWIAAPAVLRFQGTYYSEITTTALVLASWWALLHWRESRRTRWLVVLALAIGWGAITRPLTMLAFAVPIGVLVARDVVRLRLWRDLGLSLVVGTAVIAILPLWSAKTTGSWRLTPFAQYRRDYLPFDKPGFGADTTAPRRLASMDPVIRATYRLFLEIHRDHTVDALPLIATQRMVYLAIRFFQGSRLLLLPFAIAALVVGGGALRFAASSGLLVFAAYLTYAHPADWSLYYLELIPVVAALTAIGVWRAAVRIHSTDARARLAVALASVTLFAVSIPAIGQWRRQHAGMGKFSREFAKSIGQLPTRPAIVFVTYSPRDSFHVAVVRNVADLARAPVWVVHDLGPRNQALQRLAPNRATYYFDEDEIVRQLRGR